ncbi:tail fiber domain-containing protein [Brevundimonas diminuta]|uniref:tail fiber domain-containing protein n=1 Tax=Brevundimonas diminuta TaxID=293 RepID=UPI001908F216|nr:tail fiber domain-containing protein [Brevundimonas diminuta]MBK1969822.1 tail fiber domain-containing protein [Brevundimonas diminuta]
MSGLTITTLAQQVQVLLDKTKQQNSNLAAWLGGSATGGPNNDGRYPFVDLSGHEILVPSPASFSDMTSGPAAQASVAKVAAELARDLAQGHADRSDAQRILSEAARGAAVDARNLAQEHRNHAGTHEANARYWAELAQGSGQSTSQNREIIEQLAEQVSEDAALATQKATAAEASAALAATFDPNLFDKKSDTLAASRLDGMIDPARIPVLVGQTPVVSTGGIANLTTAQQNGIRPGTLVATMDGRRWVYSGSGAKNVEANYIEQGDVTPVWSVIADKPSFFPSNIVNVAGLQSALDGKSNVGHVHGIADVANLQAALDARALTGHVHAWTTITDRPTIFPTDIANVSGLQAALNAKGNLAGGNTWTSGQTFNGGITVKDSLKMTGADPYLRRDSNSAAWVMAGGQGWTDTGAVIVLHGKDHPARPGDMLLYGVNGNETSNLKMDGWKTITMNRRPTFAGATPWDSSNLGNPAVRNGYNEFQSAQVFATGGRQIRLKTNAGSAVNYGLLHHMDADNYYWLLTNQNDADGEFNGLRPLRMSLASGDIYLDRHLTTQKELHAYGDTHLPSYTRLWDRGETGYTVLEYRRQASGTVIGAHTFVSGSNDNTNFTVSVFKNGNTNDRSDLILDYNGGFSWRGRPVYTGWNFNPDDKISWNAANWDGGPYTIVRRNGDGGTTLTGRLHAYSQTATNDVWNGGMEIQEVQNVGNTQSGHAYAPALTFHWKNVCARSLWMGSDAWLYVGVQGDKSNLGNLGVNRISSDGNELWLQKAKVTKLKIHEYGINAIGNCEVDGGVYIRSNAPTITFQDSDHRSAMIHVNSNRFYVLRGSGTNSTGWESTGSGWPLEINLDNNDAYFGGQIYSGNNCWFRVRGSGNGIYWENHGGGLHMSDNDWVRVYNGKNFYCSAQVRANTVVGESDRRLKTNIAPITDAMSKVRALEGVTFDWIASGAASLGFIAQDLETVLPTLVTEDADGIKGVQYGPVVALLVEALKDADARIAVLEGRV